MPEHHTLAYEKHKFKRKLRHIFKTKEQFTQKYESQKSKFV